MAQPSEWKVVGSENIQAQLDRQLEYLDSLLEQYLRVLHEYQNARQDLSKQFSSGFFNLAQANRSAGAGRKHGQDYYDERMHASRRVSIAESGVEIITRTPQGAAEEKDGQSKGQKEGFSDPLRWFGILVPPALRSAQTDFAIAVEGPIERIVNLTRQMHQLEHDISRARKSTKKIAPNAKALDIEGLKLPSASRPSMHVL